jgi:predicted AlkP superfamily pyrophosphatase or phosphodiesterase
MNMSNQHDLGNVVSVRCARRSGAAAGPLASALLALASCAGPGAHSTMADAPAIVAGSTAVEPPGPIRHVILVTVDGLLPETYVKPEAHGLRIPTLRRIAAEGAWSEGARSVFPSVTYPAHSSIATGVRPLVHGIYTNRADDPPEKNLEGWRWYVEDLKAPPLWQVAERAGYRTALLHWPVTVGAHATSLVPEYWRARTAEDIKLTRALTTPGLFERVSAARPAFREQLFRGVLTDAALVDIATYLLETSRPHLLMLHIAEVDDAQHHHGLWSPEARAAIEEADRQLALLIEAATAAHIWGETALIVASDHGFARVTRTVHPGVLLRDQGLVRLDPSGCPLDDWKAVVLSSSGQAYIYLANAGDTVTAGTVSRLFQEQAHRPGTAIGRVYDQTEIRAAGGDPRAFLALEAQLGTAFAPGYAGKYETPPTLLAAHGYDPERAEMRASLLILGPRTPQIPVGRIADARLIDIAPTIAGWLGLSMPGVEGRSLAPSNARGVANVEPPIARTVRYRGSAGQ